MRSVFKPCAQFALDDDVSENAYGLADLRVTPTHLEQKALATVRRYRSHVSHDDALELVAKAK